MVIIEGVIPRASDSDPADQDPRRPRRRSDDTGTGEEAARILSEVIQDQREKKRRQEEARKRKPGGDGRKKIVAAGMAVIFVILLVARPDFLRPEPLPEPSRDLVEAGLRMDMYRAAVQIQRFREEVGSLPPTLTAAIEDEETDLRYTRLSAGYYLVGTRSGVELVYRSGESMDSLLGDAREVIRRGGRSAEASAPGDGE